MSREKTWHDAIQTLTSTARLLVGDAVSIALREEMNRENAEPEALEAAMRMRDRIMQIVREQQFPLITP